ncbi:c-type cytochrome [Jannaschia formosa]|uniref:c-type cytochrome n=1 Tax=Jannaschia formosa TaxID=2259592 RepID=UPI000E1B7EB2|nr:cytochrome c [Jannaschia formosa]TFL18358.1 cytochrome C [Jannaschia formosa]
MSGRLRLIAVTAAVTLVLAGAGAFVLGGFHDLSAARQHPPWLYRGLGLVRDAVVAADASEVELPEDWRPEAAAEDAALFQTHCATCHGAPGLPPAPFALGMVPAPPNLVAAARERPPGEIFWFIRDGLKMSGMPSWRFRLTEAEMWRLTALVEALPTLSPAEYRSLLSEAGALPPPDGEAAPSIGPNVLADADPERGRMAMRLHGCRSCHVIPGVVGTSDLRVGPPLGEAGERRYIAGVLPNRPEAMVRWIMDPQAVDPLSAMPDLGVAEPVARDMAAYLYALGDGPPAAAPQASEGGGAPASAEARAGGPASSHRPD